MPKQKGQPDNNILTHNKFTAASVKPHKNLKRRQTIKYFCMTSSTQNVPYLRLENSEYLGINCFQCGFDRFVLFDQLYGSFWSDSTQRIAVVTAQQDTQINELNTVISTTTSNNTSKEMDKFSPN